MLRYQEAYPAEAADLGRRFRGELPEGWREKLPVYSYPVRRFLALLLLLQTDFNLCPFC